MPTVLEAGTLNGHGIAGLHAALNYILNVGTEQIKRIECQRMLQFYEGIKHLDAVKIYGDFSSMERAPIVALNIGNYDSSAVSDELSEVYGIQTRPGAHCAPLMHRHFIQRNRESYDLVFLIFSVKNRWKKQYRQSKK